MNFKILLFYISFIINEARFKQELLRNEFTSKANFQKISFFFIRFFYLTEPTVSKNAYIL